MIRHVVLVNFKESTTDSEREDIYDGLRALRSKIDGLIADHYGPNVSPEGLGQGFRDGFMMDFRDAAARDAYLVHPDHQVAGANLVAAVEGGIGGLVVFDIRID